MKTHLREDVQRGHWRMLWILEAQLTSMDYSWIDNPIFMRKSRVISSNWIMDELAFRSFVYLPLSTVSSAFGVGVMGEKGEGVIHHFMKTKRSRSPYLIIFFMTQSQTSWYLWVTQRATSSNQSTYRVPTVCKPSTSVFNQGNPDFWTGCPASVTSTCQYASSTCTNTTVFISSWLDFTAVSLSQSSSDNLPVENYRVTLLLFYS